MSKTETTYLSYQTVDVKLQCEGIFCMDLFFPLVFCESYLCHGTPWESATSPSEGIHSIWHIRVSAAGLACRDQRWSWLTDDIINTKMLHLRALHWRLGKAKPFSFLFLESFFISCVGSVVKTGQYPTESHCKNGVIQSCWVFYTGSLQRVRFDMSDAHFLVSGDENIVSSARGHPHVSNQPLVDKTVNWWMPFMFRLT